MNKKHFSFFFSLVVLLAGSIPVFGSGSGGEALEHVNVNVRDTAAIQRGA